MTGLSLSVMGYKIIIGLKLKIWILVKKKSKRQERENKEKGEKRGLFVLKKKKVEKRI